MVCNLVLPWESTHIPTAYPHPDTNVRDFFLRGAYELGDDDLQKKFAAFFCSLFTRTRALLSESDHQGVPVSLWWYTRLNKNVTKEQLDPERVSFYDGVITEADVGVFLLSVCNNSKAMGADAFATA